MSEWTLAQKVGGGGWFGVTPDSATEGEIKLGDEGVFRRLASWSGGGRLSRYRAVRNGTGFTITSAMSGRVVKLSEDGKNILGFAWAVGDKIAVIDDHLSESVYDDDIMLVQIPAPGGLVQVRTKSTAYNTDIAAGEKLGVTTGSGLTDTAAGRLKKLGDLDDTPTLITQIHFRAAAASNNLLTDTLVLCEIYSNFMGFADSASS